MRRQRPRFIDALFPLILLTVAFTSQVVPTDSLAAPRPADAEGAPDAAYFPPTRAGWPGEWRDPRDVAAYDAFHKAAAARRFDKVREEPQPSQANYDLSLIHI